MLTVQLVVVLLRNLAEASRGPVPLMSNPHRGTQDALTVQLVVTFLRNLLAVPDPAPTAGSRGDHKTRARSELLQRLLDEHALELLLIVAQHTDEACNRGAGSSGGNLPGVLHRAKICA